jgi:hypothetical protein
MLTMLHVKGELVNKANAIFSPVRLFSSWSSLDKWTCSTNRGRFRQVLISRDILLIKT